MTTTELLATVRRVEVRTNRLVNDTMVGAYLSHFKGRGMDFEELREFLRERLAGYKVPKALVWVDEVKRSPAGKQDYRWAKDVAKDAA